MVDLYMVLLLAVLFVSLFGFISWCDKVINGNGG